MRTSLGPLPRAPRCLRRRARTGSAGRSAQHGHAPPSHRGSRAWTRVAAAVAAVGSLRSLGDELDASDRDELLQTANESLSALTTLVTDLLDVSRVEAGALGVARSGQIRVVDHGPGIPPECRPGAFLPFQRQGDNDNASGLGLGLALSRGFMEGMGGSLDAEDTPGGGLSMVMTLPLAPDEPHSAGGTS